MALVGLGGAFEGYTPVIQGDQAGPHEEEEFKRFVTEWCKEKGVGPIAGAGQGSTR